MRPRSAGRALLATIRRMSPPADPGAALKALARAMELQQRGHLDEAEAVYAKLLAAATLPSGPLDN